MNPRIGARDWGANDGHMNAGNVVDTTPTPLLLAEIIQQFNNAGNDERVKSEEQLQIGEQVLTTVEVAKTAQAERSTSGETIEIITHEQPASVAGGATVTATAEIMYEQASNELMQGSQVKRETVDNSATTPLLDPSKTISQTYNSFLEPPTYMSRETATTRVYQQKTDVSSFMLPTFDPMPVAETPYKAPEFTLSEMVDDYDQQSTSVDAVDEAEFIATTDEVVFSEQYEETEPFSPQHEMIIGIIAELVGDETPKDYDYLAPEFLQRSEAAIDKINLLEKAPTVEEVRELLLEIRQELRALLQLLGCSDVERTTAKLMSDLRNIMRIKQYIEALLQLAMYTGASTTRSQMHAITYPQRHRFGKWVVSKVTGGIRVVHVTSHRNTVR